MRLLRAIAVAIPAAVAFGSAVYWMVRESESESVSVPLCVGDFTTGTDPSGRWIHLQLRADGTCSRWPRWTEGRQQVFGTEEAGRWTVTESGALALSWEGGAAEPVTFVVDERGNAEMRAGAQLYQELVPFDCY